MDLDNFKKDSPIPTQFLNIIGFYFLIVLILCVFFNLTLLLIFIRYKELRIRLNIFIISVTLFNLVGSSVFPFVIHSNLSHKWTSSVIGCKFSGFIMYFAACTNVYLMTLISVERYYILKFPTNVKNLNKKNVTLAILVSILLGLFWSAMPLLGWSHYSLEDSLTSCSVEWKEKSFNVMSYNVSIFIFVFIIPFGFIIFSNLKSILIVSFVYFVYFIKITKLQIILVHFKGQKQKEYDLYSKFKIG